MTFVVCSVFGFCQVPAWVYPLVMLVLMSVVVPGVSLVGHLSGLLVGYVYAKGFLNWFTLKRSWLIAIEELEFLLPITRATMFVRCARQPVIKDPVCLAGYVCMCHPTRMQRA